MPPLVQRLLSSSPSHPLLPPRMCMAAPLNMPEPRPTHPAGLLRGGRPAAAGLLGGHPGRGALRCAAALACHGMSAAAQPASRASVCPAYHALRVGSSHNQPSTHLPSPTQYALDLPPGARGGGRLRRQVCRPRRPAPLLRALRRRGVHAGARPGVAAGCWWGRGQGSSGAAVTASMPVRARGVGVHAGQCACRPCPWHPDLHLKCPLRPLTPCPCAHTGATTRNPQGMMDTALSLGLPLLTHTHCTHSL